MGRVGDGQTAGEESVDPANERTPKTAVVLIHGMGEQRPMSTLWDFVDAVWSTDRTLVEDHDAEVYAKPDTVSENYDLRRITTRYWKAPDRRRVDFHEFYWAHLMTGNTVQGTVSWIRAMFLRPPSSVPRGLRRYWALGLVFLLSAMALAALASLPAAITILFLDRQAAAIIAALAFLGGLIATGWLAPVAGDAARYFSADPPNIEARQAIRRAGVEIIERLTRSGEYDRIIVVGHSLGSAIGLDVLATAYERIKPQTWSDVHPPRSQAARLLRKVELAAGRLMGEPGSELHRTAYQDAQRAYAKALRLNWAKGSAPWLVSDFVTLGSPLSKADILVTRDRKEFNKRTAARSLPTAPPRLEQISPPRFSFKVARDRLGPHYAAPFASTVWTNLYFPSLFVAIGDIISGPVAPLFGPAVKDVEIPIGAPRFRHNDYWRKARLEPTPPWITALRQALSLRL